ncbi:MAG: GNAT family N-acetyltransferase [Rhodoferax sp.]|uniref:GNAT family N-acetyltransferase n=1 Tax=Rhodoferax sp. TaxID=50421 RepID=UPI0013FFFFDF|nr:GNAT family N-acetyltransferase [Rhodoferax sp.]NDP41070.1 GNAT family N-acetyltransferase [Rhodoferax sp.]
MKIRTAQHEDSSQILQLNEESVQFLSPLNSGRLALLRTQCAYHRVLEDEGQIASFLLAFREGAAYDSPNYRWFVTRYPRFLYIDRVVVSSSMRGRGVGRLLYEDLFAFGRASGIDLVTCEFDLEPPNPSSKRFHARHGFAEVGTQTYGPEQKLVSLQAVNLDVWNGA